MIDLHTHTVFSDGTTTPEENATLAVEAGLTGVALTDHDTFDGWRRMADACLALALQFVPGLELSAELDDGSSVHILGYWVDPSHVGLAYECVRLRGERERRARVMVQRMQAMGIPVTWERVSAFAGRAPVGRPHLAAALVEVGAVADHDAAFHELLADHGPVYEPKQALAPAVAVELVVAAGGAAVLAHPGLTFPTVAEAGDLLERLSAAGLAGVEAEHAAHDAESVIAWRRAAAATGLAVTGSSDFHGNRKTVSIGAGATSPEVVQALRERSTGGERW